MRRRARRKSVREGELKEKGGERREDGGQMTEIQKRKREREMRWIMLCL